LLGHQEWHQTECHHESEKHFAIRVTIYKVANLFTHIDEINHTSNAIIKHNDGLNPDDPAVTKGQRHNFTDVNDVLVFVVVSSFD